MKITSIQTLAITLCACAVSATVAQAWDFSYGYQTVFDANADSYIVGQQNVRKYSEWQNPPATYWGPSANDVPATLTRRFTFSAPTTEIFLKFKLLSANGGNRGDYGSSSLWASTDGVSWQILLDCPTPFSSGGLTGQQLYYNQDVPTALLGGTDFWTQVRMQEHGALATAPDPRATWADAQFSRWDSPSGGEFQLNAMVVPEPGTASLVILGGLAMLRAVARKSRA